LVASPGAGAFGEQDPHGELPCRGIRNYDYAPLPVRKDLGSMNMQVLHRPPPSLMAAAEATRHHLTWPDVAGIAVVVIGFVAFIWVMLRDL
jgi:hypothetical protein